MTEVDSPVYTFEIRSAQGLCLDGVELKAWRMSPGCFGLPGRHRYCRLPGCACKCHKDKLKG